MHERLIHGALARAAPCFLLVVLAGPLAAQDVRTYGYVALKNATIHVYTKDSAGTHSLRVGVWSRVHFDGRYYGGGYVLTPWDLALAPVALRQLAARVDSGLVIVDSLVERRFTARLRCAQGACAVTVQNAGLADSLVTAPGVTALQLVRLASALEAAGRRDTAFAPLVDSLP
jgi:hypothetical protein